MWSVDHLVGQMGGWVLVVVLAFAVSPPAVSDCWGHIRSLRRRLEDKARVQALRVIREGKDGSGEFLVHLAGEPLQEGSGQGVPGGGLGP